MMMMIQQQQQQRHPTVEIPQMYEDPTAGGPLTPAAFSPQTCNYLTALSRYLPSSSPEEEEEAAEYSCDEFRMYEFKVRRCPRGRSHDWTDCPYAHPGEKARRRDPRRHRYSGSSCPDFRRGCCRRGDACDLAHGVFESWLHPSRYRTQPCKDGPHCQRRVCFFAHSPEQLRVVGPDALSLSLSLSSDASLSPPMSPPQRRVCFPLSSPPSSPTVDDLAAAMRGLKVGPRRAGPGFGSPRTPTARPGLGALDTWWEGGEGEEGAPVMERVESGRGIRERMYQRLSRENSLLERDSDRADPAGPGGPDFGWVSELVK